MSLEKLERFARRALEKLLRKEALSDDELAELINQHQEHAYLDFKDGIETAQKSKFRNTVREYVAAFANADGGILCVGPGNQKNVAGRRPCSPLTRPSTETSVADWCRDVTAELVPYLSPLPRITVQEYLGNGVTTEVLLVAVARAPALVPLYGQAKRPTWWVRFHDRNRELPEYLAADILVGRRTQPLLHLCNPRVVPNVPKLHNDPNVVKERHADVELAATVENIGFNVGEDIQVGVLSFSLAWDQPAPEPSSHLLQYIDVQPVGEYFRPWEYPAKERWPLVHAVSFADSAPSQSVRLSTWQRQNLKFAVSQRRLLKLQVPVRKGGATLVQAALYLLAAGCGPQWFQLEFVLHEFGGPHYGFRCEELDLKRLHFDRPRVSLSLKSPP